MVCDADIVNSTTLSLTSGANYFVLGQVAVNSTCHLAVEGTGVMIRGADDMLAGSNFNEFLKCL